MITINTYNKKRQFGIYLPEKDSWFILPKSQTPPYLQQNYHTPHMRIYYMYGNTLFVHLNLLWDFRLGYKLALFEFKKDAEDYAKEIPDDRMPLIWKDNRKAKIIEIKDIYKTSLNDFDKLKTLMPK